MGPMQWIHFPTGQATNTKIQILKYINISSDVFKFRLVHGCKELLLQSTNINWTKTATSQFIKILKSFRNQSFPASFIAVVLNWWVWNQKWRVKPFSFLSNPSVPWKWVVLIGISALSELKTWSEYDLVWRISVVNSNHHCTSVRWLLNEENLGRSYFY